MHEYGLIAHDLVHDREWVCPFWNQGKLIALLIRIRMTDHHHHRYRRYSPSRAGSHPERSADRTDLHGRQRHVDWIDGGQLADHVHDI